MGYARRLRLVAGSAPLRASPPSAKSGAATGQSRHSRVTREPGVGTVAGQIVAGDPGSLHRGRWLCILTCGVQSPTSNCESLAS